MAMNRGLSCAIINPNSEEMMRAYDSFLALAVMTNSAVVIYIIWRAKRM